MFGITIIKEERLNELLNVEKKCNERMRKALDDAKRCKEEREDLRDQLNTEIKRRNSLVNEVDKHLATLTKLKEQIEELSKEEKDPQGLHNLAVLKNDSYPCDTCAIESSNCKKLIFANQTICVVEKAKVNSFRPKKRKK